MQSVKISELKGLIKPGDYVGDSMKLKEVESVTDTGFHCYNDYGFSDFNNDQEYTTTWISKEAMLSALGQSLQTFAKHCIKKAEKENE